MCSESREVMKLNHGRLSVLAQPLNRNKRGNEGIEIQSIDCSLRIPMGEICDRLEFAFLEFMEESVK